MLSSWLISFHPYYYFYLHGCKIAAVLPGLQLIQEKEKKRNTSKVYTIFLWKQESFQKLHSRSLFRSHNLEMCLMGIPCSKSIGQQMQSCCYVCSMHYLLKTGMEMGINSCSKVLRVKHLWGLFLVQITGDRFAFGKFSQIYKLLTIKWLFIWVN